MASNEAFKKALSGTFASAGYNGKKFAGSAVSAEVCRFRMFLV